MNVEKCIFWLSSELLLVSICLTGGAIDADSDEERATASGSSAITSIEHGEVQPSDLPFIWTMKLYTNHLKTKPWLLCKNGKLGCKVCAEVGSFNDFQKKGKGRNISAVWSTSMVECNGLSVQSQLSSLRKKIKEHNDSISHKMAVDMSHNQYTAADNPLKCKFDEGHSHLSETTSSCFLTAYIAAKNARPFVDFEADIELQQLNGCNMGRILHSDVTCANVTSHISVEIKRKLAKQCIESDSKFSVLLDESTSLSKKSCLIIYIRSLLPGYESPVTFFLDLVELAQS